MRNFFTNKLMLSGLLLLSLTVMHIFSSCSREETEIGTDTMTIDVITGFNGKGDQDYTALIYQTLEKWGNYPGVKMNIHIPENDQDALNTYKEWAANSGKEQKALMVVAASDHSDMLQKERLELNKNQQVLGFEMIFKEPVPGVSTFIHNRYGSSYLAGHMLSDAKEVIVIAGTKTNDIECAWKAFEEGLSKECSFKVEYLSDDFDGFNMPEEAKKIAAEHPNAVIYPLAGKSNNGIYQYLNECDQNANIFALGVDINCNELSDRIPFSLILKIDETIDQYIQSWIDGKKWPVHQTVDMKKGMVDIIINENYKPVNNIGKDTYKNLYDQYKGKAMDKEDEFFRRQSWGFL